jgi:hypothetical protein
MVAVQEPAVRPISFHTYILLNYNMLLPCHRGVSNAWKNIIQYNEERTGVMSQPLMQVAAMGRV